MVRTIGRRLSPRTLTAGLVLLLVASALVLGMPAESADPRTLEVTVHDLFRVPSGGFGDAWARRSEIYHRDVVLSNAFPYLVKHTPDPTGDPGNYFLTAGHRLTVAGRALPEMSIDTPVVLPRLGRTTAAGGSAVVDLGLTFLDRAGWDALRASGLITLTWDFNDGYGALLAGTVTMDALGAEKVLGLTGDPAAWWSSNAGKATTAWSDWLDVEGNDRLEVFSAHRLPFAEFGFRLSLTTSPPYVVVRLELAAFGIDALLARWLYWGTSDYLREAPAGALPFEMAFDSARLVVHLTSTADLDLSAEVVYALRAWASSLESSPGGPAWVWQPTLRDVIPSDPRINPLSELDAYAGMAYVHRTPGSPRYGAALAYEFAPAAWDLAAGETLRFLVPRESVRFFAPPSGGTSDRLVALGGCLPSCGGAWDPVGGVLEVRGPWPMAAPAPPSVGMPWIELVPGAAVPAGSADRRHP